MRARFIFAFVLVTLVVGGGLIAALWRAPTPRTILVLNNAAVAEAAFNGLRDGLAALGWREGRDIQFLHPGPQPSTTRLRTQARDLIDGNTALVVTLSTPAALAAREEAERNGLPLLMAPAADPVAVGLVSGLSHPGQQITGVAFGLQEARRLEYLTRIVPAARRIWVPFDHADPSPQASFLRLREAAAKLGLTLVEADVRGQAALRAALDTLPMDVDAIFVPPDAALASNLRPILSIAAARNLPVSVPHRDGVAQGALFSYGFDLYAAGKQAARLADRILSGTPAADLPIEFAEMEVTLNLAAADRLGLRIPDDILRHANIVGRPGE